MISRYSDASVGITLDVDFLCMHGIVKARALAWL